MAAVESQGDVKINAVAGSGKTTLLIEYAKKRKGSILYLAFNKSVKDEARRRFAGLPHVRVETAHSLAFHHMVKGTSLKLRANGYKTHELADLLGIRSSSSVGTFVMANHIRRYADWFMNSRAKKLRDLDYMTQVQGERARGFVEGNRETIYNGAMDFLSKMYRGEAELTHDFYLKMFQLREPMLDFDFILFDEGQDASPSMLDVFLNQRGTKVIVGDTNQQIYGWRHAINSLENTDLPALALTNSFRFNQNIANLASEILDRKHLFVPHDQVVIHGTGPQNKDKTHAVLARSNLGLLLRATEAAFGEKPVRRIHFEGNFSTYAYAGEGASLYDVLNLKNGKHERIRDPLIAHMNDIKELTEYVDATDDRELGMMVSIVEKYGKEIPTIMRELKNRHTEDRRDAQMIFSTVHRAKGMEYGTVTIAPDFPTESNLKKQAEEDDADLARLNEEVNTLYVAVTRAINRLEIPGFLMPKDFEAGKGIEVIESKKEPELPENVRRNSRQPYKNRQSRPRRKKATNANRVWTKADDHELVEMDNAGQSIPDIADHFGRSKMAVWMRLKKILEGY